MDAGKSYVRLALAIRYMYVDRHVRQGTGYISCWILHHVREVIRGEGGPTVADWNIPHFHLSFSLSLSFPFFGESVLPLFNAKSCCTSNATRRTSLIVMLISSLILSVMLLGQLKIPFSAGANGAFNFTALDSSLPMSASSQLYHTGVPMRIIPSLTLELPGDSKSLVSDQLTLQSPRGRTCVSRS